MQVANIVTIDHIGTDFGHPPPTCCAASRTSPEPGPASKMMLRLREAFNAGRRMEVVNHMASDGQPFWTVGLMRNLATCSDAMLKPAPLEASDSNATVQTVDVLLGPDGHRSSVVVLDVMTDDDIAWLRKSGLSTRIGFAHVAEHLQDKIARLRTPVTNLLRDPPIRHHDPTQRPSCSPLEIAYEALQRNLTKLTAWHIAEANWSTLLRRTLADTLSPDVMDCVDAFLFGPPCACTHCASPAARATPLTERSARSR